MFLVIVDKDLMMIGLLDLRIQFGCFRATFQKQSVRQFHDVCFVHSDHLFTTQLGCVIESKFGNSPRLFFGNDFHAFDDPGNWLMLKCWIFSFRLFSYGDEINVGVSRSDAFKSRKSKQLANNSLKRMEKMFDQMTFKSMDNEPSIDLMCTTLANKSSCLRIFMFKVSNSPLVELKGVDKIPFKAIPFLLIDSITVSTETLMLGLTSLKNNSSKWTGTDMAWKTSLTAKHNSGPTPSPGIRVHFTLLSSFSCGRCCCWPALTALVLMNAPGLQCRSVNALLPVCCKEINKRRQFPRQAMISRKEFVDCLLRTNLKKKEIKLSCRMDEISS